MCLICDLQQLAYYILLAIMVAKDFLSQTVYVGLCSLKFMNANHEA